jgi:hypothetical protein
MLLDYWTAHYAEIRRNGTMVEEFEDDEFDLDAIRRAGEGDWEAVP